MPAPTATDGAARGIEELAVPSVFAILVVMMSYYFYGGIVAGLLFIVISILGFVVLIRLAKYWNAAYTVGFVAAGFLALLMIPSVLGELVHPAFDIFGTIVAFFVLAGIASLLMSKLNLSNSSRR